MTDDGQAHGIGDARLALHEGKQCRRGVWPEGEWIVLSREWVAETGHARAVMTFKPLIVYRDQNASVGPWHPTQDDILAWDWKII